MQLETVINKILRYIKDKKSDLELKIFHDKINQVKNMLLKVKKTNCGINISKSLS